MKRKAFTLIELIVVMVILAILISLALPTFMGMRSKAYRAEALQIFSEVKLLAWGYNLEHLGIPGNSTQWPDEMSDLYPGAASPDTDNWVFNYAGTQENAPVGSGLTCSSGAPCIIFNATGNSTNTEGQSVRMLIDLDAKAYVD